MSAVSLPASERARKNLQAVLQGLASVGQAHVAAALETSESTVSRMKDGELEKIARLLAVLGLKVVPVTVKCYDPAFIESIFHLAKQRMAQVETADELSWD